MRTVYSPNPKARRTAWSASFDWFSPAASNFAFNNQALELALSIYNALSTDSIADVISPNCINFEDLDTQPSDVDGSLR